MSINPDAPMHLDALHARNKAAEKRAGQLFDALFDAFAARLNYEAGEALHRNQYDPGYHFSDTADGRAALDTQESTKSIAIKFLKDIV